MKIDRPKSFRKLLKTKKIVRILEAHSGFSALIVEHTKVRKRGKSMEFDGIWISSFTDSASRGKPDASIVSFSSKIITINEILEVTTKPIVVDLDNGGQIKHFLSNLKSLEKLGVSGVAIEDKVGLKKNSLLETRNNQKQDSITHFCTKIKLGKISQTTKNFMIIARIESLILGKGMDDALKRASAYIESGADAILIHSKDKRPKEILEFASIYENITKKVPLFVVPTTYNSVREEDLTLSGVKVVIYANQLLRSAYPSMVRTAQAILRNGRALEADKNSLPVKELLRMFRLREVN